MTVRVLQSCLLLWIYYYYFSKLKVKSLRLTMKRVSQQENLEVVSVAVLISKMTMSKLTLRFLQLMMLHLKHSLKPWQVVTKLANSLKVKMILFLFLKKCTILNNFTLINT